MALWLTNAAAFWIGFAAFDIQVPFAGALVLQGILVLAIAMPQAPGFVGFFEGAVKVALALYAIDGERALAFAVTYHVATFVPITLLGAWSALQSGAHRRLA